MSKLEIGSILQNRYSIRRIVGSGGMGGVYQAIDSRLDVPVALKVMRSDSRLNPQMLVELRAQFREEAVVLARLKHPHLVNVTDFFEEEDNVYLVMEWVEGENLSDRVSREGALPESEVLNLADQILDALDYCHSRNIIHRDVKPHNIILQRDGQAILVDFGLVKLWNPDSPSTGPIIRGMGTPDFAPPEQYSHRDAHTDPRSDIYNLGATLYYALSGGPPPSAMDRIANPSTSRQKSLTS